MNIYNWQSVLTGWQKEHDGILFGEIFPSLKQAWASERKSSEALPSIDNILVVMPALSEAESILYGLATYPVVAGQLPR